MAALEQKVAELDASQSVLLYDFFYSNDDETVSVPGSGAFQRLERPGLFCVQAGETVSIGANVSINVVGPGSVET